MIWEKSITAEQLNVKIVSYNLYSHSTAPQLRQSSHFNPPIASKVIHIQSLRDYFNPLFALPITHYQSLLSSIPPLLLNKNINTIKTNSQTRFSSRKNIPNFFKRKHRTHTTFQINHQRQPFSCSTKRKITPNTH